MHILNFSTPIFYACRHGNLKFVEILTKSDADINAVDFKKRVPLNYVDEKIKKFPDNKAYTQIQDFLKKAGGTTDWKYDS
jgi:hypothetical protein